MSGIPAVTVAQMREVDRIMVDELHIELLQMMENAGRCLAAHTRSWLGGQLAGRQVVVLAGSGGNGGGGLVAARRLTIWGAAAAVILGQPRGELGGVPAHQLEILGQMGVPVWAADQSPPGTLAQADAILDALIGYSLQGPPREPIASLIGAANRASAPVIALDVPPVSTGILARRSTRRSWQQPPSPWPCPRRGCCGPRRGTGPATSTSRTYLCRFRSTSGSASRRDLCLPCRTSFQFR